MPLPLNPYVAGNPVGGSEAFIGRADVLREVVRVLRRPQDNAIVLYGQRRIGKTSVLQELETQLPGEGPYRPVYFDLENKADWPLGRVLRELARTIAHTVDLPAPDFDDHPETAFREEWLPEALDALPGGCSLVLLFDEFDVLADPESEQAAATFFPYLRGLLAQDRERLQFVFVIGRNVDDLDTIALSLFKATPSMRVSLFSKKDTADLVRLSERNDTLRWPDEAMERVYELTNGHPFLTQQLCSHVWERVHDEEETRFLGETWFLSPDDVDAAVPGALEASRSTLEWLWDGLPPAERVVASALAEAGPEPIPQDELEQLLHESGVRVVIRELQNAPELLQEWDLIEPVDGGYRFRVELLRRWLAEHKPLRRVQEELDRIEPVAENLYQAGSGMYQSGQLDEAIGLLRQAIGLNPNHVKANQLLADILLAQEQPGEARELLERLYEYQRAAARSRLVQALLAQAQAAENEDERLSLYDQVLELNPRQPEATAGRKRIWRERGDAALEDDDLEAALRAYQEVDLTDKVSEVKQEIRRRDLVAGLQKLEELQQVKQYQEALDLAHKLADEYPEAQDQLPDLEQLERKTHLADLYQRSLGALQSGDRERAQRLLAQVVTLEPEYEEATRYLHNAVTGVDIAEVQHQLEKERAARREAETTAEKEAEGHHSAWLVGAASGAITLVLIVGLFFVWYRYLGGWRALAPLQPTPTPTADPTDAPVPTGTPEPTVEPTAAPIPKSRPTDEASVPTAGEPWTRPADGAVMVYVPAGEFQMGSDEGYDDEQPVHEVRLDGFWIDEYEVTNAQYAAFLNEEGNQEEGGETWLDIDDGDCLIEQSGGEFQPRSGYGDHPVIEVSWYGAAAYCEWSGGRLPTEAEWEYAARGPERHIYPWGNEGPTCDLAQYFGCPGSTVSVVSFPEGASWCGAQNLAGNVWEWVADWYDEDYYADSPVSNPTGPSSGEDRVLRGGS